MYWSLWWNCGGKVEKNPIIVYINFVIIVGITVVIIMCNYHRPLIIVLLLMITSELILKIDGGCEGFGVAKYNREHERERERDTYR